MGHVDAVTPTAFAVLLLSQATLASSQPTQTPRPFSAAEMLTAGQASQHTAIRYFVQANRHPRYVVSRNIPDHHVRRLMRHRRWRRIAACVSFGHPPVEANSSDVCGATNHSCFSHPHNLKRISAAASFTTMPSLSFQLLLLALCTATASAQMSSANAIPVSAITLPWADPSSTSSSNAFSSSPSNAANASSPSSPSFPSASGNASATTTGKYPTTTDNSCGAEVNRMCLITGVNPCCSGDGFCGNTPDYCGSACQSDYGACGTNVSASTTNSTLGNPACSWAGEGTSPRCDGRCGSEYNNAICSSEAGPDDFVAYGVFGYGPCCSSGGFCGNTTGHCNAGCQSGCDGTDGSAASSSSAAATATVTVTTSAAASATGMASRIVGASEGCGTFALVVSLIGALLAV